MAPAQVHVGRRGPGGRVAQRKSRGPRCGAPFPAHEGRRHRQRPAVLRRGDLDVEHVFGAPLEVVLGAGELVQALMCVEPGARMKLSEVMAHPWVVGDGTDLPWEAVTARAMPCAEVLPAGEEGEEEDEVQEEVQEEATATASGLPMSSEPAAETSPDLECEPSPPPRETDSDLAGAVLFALDNISIKPFQL